MLNCVVLSRLGLWKHHKIGMRWSSDPSFFWGYYFGSISEQDMEPNYYFLIPQVFSFPFPSLSTSFFSFHFLIYMALPAFFVSLSLSVPDRIRITEDMVKSWHINVEHMWANLKCGQSWKRMLGLKETEDCGINEQVEQVAIFCPTLWFKPYPFILFLVDTALLCKILCKKVWERVV